MRDIKFRAWHDNKMYDVVAMDWFQNENGILSMHLLRNKKTKKIYPYKDYGDEVIQMQYIPTKDKKGKILCEGDVVKFSYIHGHGMESRGVIEYQSTRFVIKDMANDDEYWIDQCIIKKLGNIYENPELLK